MRFAILGGFLGLAVTVFLSPVFGEFPRYLVLKLLGIVANRFAYFNLLCDACFLFDNSF